MISLKSALKSDRVMKATTGLSVSEFNHLAKSFGQELENEGQIRYEREVEQGNRARKPGGRKIRQFEKCIRKIVFILFYFKCYPTFDVLGLLFDLDRSNTCRNVQKLTPILENVLGKKMVLPSRKINSLKELLEIFIGVKDLFIDGTERPIQRPKDKEKQKKNYSGKKKAHTRKNIIITDKNKKIGFLSPPEDGKMHDYSIFKDIFPPRLFPKYIMVWLDLAFIGFDKDYPEACVMMPKKKPRGKELTDEEKAQNKTIAGIKQLRITTDKFRNKTDSFNDKAMLISCGLWNYHLKYH